MVERGFGDHTALIGNGRRRTYKELSDWTNRIARPAGSPTTGAVGQADPGGTQPLLPEGDLAHRLQASQG